MEPKEIYLKTLYTTIPTYALWKSSCTVQDSEW